MPADESRVRLRERNRGETMRELSEVPRLPADRRRGIVPYRRPAARRAGRALKVESQLPAQPRPPPCIMSAGKFARRQISSASQWEAARFDSGRGKGNSLFKQNHLARPRNLPRHLFRGPSREKVCAGFRQSKSNSLNAMRPARDRPMVHSALLPGK